jgi:hypothetical protein
MGVPAGYTPFQTPINPTPKEGGSSPDPNFPYESNFVLVPLKDDTQQRVSYDTNLHTMLNHYVPGPMLWSMNASAFKAIRITETVSFRFNIDFFNVFNTPGTNLPNANTGIILNQVSANFPRVLQLTARLAW